MKIALTLFFLMLPFIALFGMIWKIDGIKVAAIVCGISFALLLWLFGCIASVQYLQAI